MKGPSQWDTSKCNVSTGEKSPFRARACLLLTSVTMRRGELKQPPRMTRESGIKSTHDRAHKRKNWGRTPSNAAPVLGTYVDTSWRGKLFENLELVTHSHT